MWFIDASFVLKKDWNENFLVQSEKPKQINQRTKYHKHYSGMVTWNWRQLSFHSLISVDRTHYVNFRWQEVSALFMWQIYDHRWQFAVGILMNNPTVPIDEQSFPHQESFVAFYYALFGYIIECSKPGIWHIDHLALRHQCKHHAQAPNSNNSTLPRRLLKHRAL